MKSFKNALFTAILTLSLVSTAFAGNIPTGKTGNIPTGEGGNIPTGVAIIEQVIISVLSLVP